MKRILSLIIAAALISTLICSCSDKPAVTDDTTVLAQGGSYKGEAIKIDGDFRHISDMELYGNTLYMLAYSFNGEGASPIYHICTYDTEADTFQAVTYPQISNAYELAVSKNGILVEGSEYDAELHRSIKTVWCVRDGKTVWDVSLTDIMECDDIGNNTHVGALGDTWFVSEAYTLALFSADGTLITKHELPSEAAGMFESSGTMQIYGCDMRADNEFCISVTEDGTVAESGEWLGILNKISFSNIFHGCDSGVYYKNDSTLVYYNAADGTHTPLLDWVASGIYHVTVDALAVHPSGDVYICGGEADGRTQSIRRFSPVPADMLTEKQIVRVTYIEDGRNAISLAAVKFNQSQTEYEIVCEDYYSASKDGDYASVLTSFDLDIASGNAGDIIILDSPEDVEKYAEKGLFADLYTLGVPSLSADNIYGCVREVCEQDGKLYSIPREFTLRTCVTKEVTAASFGEWGIADYLKKAASLDGGQNMLFSNKRDYVLARLLPYAVGECIDEDGNACAFETDTFIAFLEYIRSLPEENTVPNTGSANRYITDEILLYEHDIGCYAQIAQLLGVYGRDTAYAIIGYPSGTDNAASLTGTHYLAVNESSTVKDGAAAFVEYLLSADTVINENKGMRQFPSLKSTTEGWNESEVQYYYTFDMSDTSGYSCGPEPSEETETVICVAMDEKFITETYAFLDSVHIVGKLPDELLAIVNEEIASFIGGASDAAECARFIDNRIGIYLAERG